MIINKMTILEFKERWIVLEDDNYPFIQNNLSRSLNDAILQLFEEANEQPLEPIEYFSIKDYYPIANNNLQKD